MQTNTLEREAMKFVLNGRTFDTATATKTAISRGINFPRYNSSLGDSEVRYEDILYRTAKGAFFVHEHRTEKFVSGGKPVVTDSAREVTPEQAADWVIEEGAIVLDSAGLPLPDEA